jgi:hypothetical protein
LVTVKLLAAPPVRDLARSQLRAVVDTAELGIRRQQVKQSRAMRSTESAIWLCERLQPRIFE